MSLGSPGPARPAVLLLVLAGAACQESTRPETSSDSPDVMVQYVCGNGFDLENLGDSALTVQYEVLGTGEAGEMLLPPRGDRTSPGATRLVTLKPGALRISHAGGMVAQVENGATSCASAPLVQPQATEGEWSLPFPWPVVAVHLHLLPDHTVLSWGAVGSPQVWDRQTGRFTGAPSATELFCSGHAFLPDGRLLVTGGHITYDHGLPDANVFDPTTGTWASLPPMSRGRWYPTSTTLSSGEVLTLAGRDESGAVVDVPEVWTGGGWRKLTGARRALPYYPRTFVAPNGLVFYAGESQATAYLDAGRSGSWTPVANSNYGRRDYGSAVMYRPGQVLILGGSDPPDGAPTNTAEVIDLAEATPAWRYTASMRHARRHLNATLLPDGRILVTGGTSAAGFTDPAGAVNAAELWDPATERWALLARNRVNRVYHSTALLLHDGRVLLAGSGDGAQLPREVNAELYSPPYLFVGPRPRLDGAPALVSYGQSFLAETPDAGRVVRASLIRLGSVTHGFDQNQRFLELSLRRTAGGIVLTAPLTPDLAPPGDYLLFLLNDTGTPSVGKTVRVR